ncbi:hypothetical protein [Yersinia pseudotuberculosis]|uniref:hypothetical protein n=1 Tax=Yersinia pseudotuberculosis TaxID=633 RepID=UPI0005DDC7E6|nr:hypothetical protein [Yersinia pseudotuberculosis]CND20389.1 Uncharacterised protein [Yersinia pseudotuberculosis]
MSSVEKISKQIVTSLRNDGKPPIYWRFTTAIGETVIDFSKDTGYFVYEYLDTENRGRNSRETIRLLRRLKSGVSNDDIRRLVVIVVDEYTIRVKQDALDSLAEKLGKLTGKYFISNVLMQDIASLFAKKIISKIILNSSLTLAITLGGLRARAIYLSEELKIKSPDIYYLLKKDKDLDLFYFMVSDFLDPFIEAINLKKTDPEKFDKIFINVVNGLSK